MIRDSYVVKGGIGVKKIAQFYKVSLETFTAAIQKDFPQYNLDEILELYNTIQLPRRATQGSAGYDFYAPFSFALLPGRTIKIPTGIRAWMEDGWVLKLYPRSGLVFIKMTNETREDKTVEIQQGIGFAQGIFLEYGITLDDCTDGIRNGGLGSTTR